MSDANQKSQSPKTKLLSKDSFVKEYKESTRKKVLLDCRNPEETALGTLPNAHVIPLPDFEKRVAEIPRDAEVFIYCRTGNRAKTAAIMLEENGVQSIKIAVECGYAELKSYFAD